MDLIIGILVLIGLAIVFRLPKNPRRNRTQAVAMVKGRGAYSCDVVGESRYQDALERIVGGRSEDGASHKCIAHIVPEPTNRHDANAMRIDIDGMTVGYLSRQDAVTLRERLRARGVEGTVSAKAMIVGGWDRGDDDVGHFGVRLDVPIGDR